MNRRRFLQTGGAAALSLMRPSAPRAVRLSLDPAAPIATKVSTLQSFLGKHYFHESGIMYAMWRYDAAAGEARPCVESDLEDQKFWPKIPCSKVDWMHGENSTFTSGLFLASQALRYKATRDDEALQFAARAFGSIDAIATLGEKAGKRGWMSKPYGWAVSDETSPDQYLAAALGLWQYRPVAPQKTRERIDDLLASWADWWQSQAYTLVYFGQKSDFFASPVHRGVFPCLHALAFSATGRTKYQDEARRLLGLMDGWKTQLETRRSSPWYPGDFPAPDESRRKHLLYDGEHRGATWMTLVAADLLAAEVPALAPTLKTMMTKSIRYARMGMRDDLLHHYVVAIDLEREEWHVIPDTKRGFQWHPHASAMCWGDAAGRLPDAAVIVGAHEPTEADGMAAFAKALWQKLENRRLQWFVDPDGRQIPPEVRYIERTLSSEVPADTCLSYWRARATGFLR